MQFNFKSGQDDKKQQGVKAISLGKRVCIYLLAMGVLGAVVGAVDSRVSLNKCLDIDNCSEEQLTSPEIMRMGIGACAGMIAAGLISLPAMLEED